MCASYDKRNAIVYAYATEDSAGIGLSLAHERNRADSRRPQPCRKRIKYGNRHPNRDAAWSAADPIQLSDWMFEVILDYGEGHYVEEVPDLQGCDFTRAALDAPPNSH